MWCELCWWKHTAILLSDFQSEQSEPVMKLAVWHLHNWTYLCCSSAVAMLAPSMLSTIKSSTVCLLGFSYSVLSLRISSSVFSSANLWQEELVEGLWEGASGQELEKWLWVGWNGEARNCIAGNIQSRAQSFTRSSCCVIECLKLWFLGFVLIAGLY